MPILMLLRNFDPLKAIGRTVPIPLLKYIHRPINRRTLLLDPPPHIERRGPKPRSPDSDQRAVGFEEDHPHGLGVAPVVDCRGVVAHGAAVR